MYYRFVDIVRQAVTHTGNLFAHFAGHSLRVYAHVKLQYGFAVAFKHGTGNCFIACNLADAVFYRLGNKRFHFFRRSAVVSNAHADDRHINVRVQIYADFRVAADAEHYQQQNKHGSKNRPADKSLYHN